MAKGSGARTACRALLAAIGVALGISGAAADDPVGSEQIGASEADDAASMATDGGGRRLWSRQPGTFADDSAADVATDKDGNVYVVGGTGGALVGPNQGRSDAWVIKFDGDGHRLWSRQPGTNADDFAFGVATDKDGNVYVVGGTDGALVGPRKGKGDPWVIKFDGDGDPLWSQQPGTVGNDRATGVATDTDGNVSVVGWTLGGVLGGPSKGGYDAWVIQYAR